MGWVGWDHRNDRHMPGLWGIKLRMVSLLTQSCYTGFRGRKIESIEFDKPPSRFSGLVQNSRSLFFFSIHVSIYNWAAWGEGDFIWGYINQVRISLKTTSGGRWVESRQHSEVEPKGFTIFVGKTLMPHSLWMVCRSWTTLLPENQQSPCLSMSSASYRYLTLFEWFEWQKGARIWMDAQFPMGDH